MDSYVEEFQAAGGSHVMLAKGNRSKAVTEACKSHGGFYLGSIGGPAATPRPGLHHQGRGARVRGAGHGGGLEDRGRQDFPAFIVVDDKGNDFFDLVNKPYTGIPVKVS